MKLKSKELIKVLLSEKKIKLKDLVEKLTEITGRKYTPDSFSHKMGRRTISYYEMLIITEILGYSIEIKNTHNELI